MGTRSLGVFERALHLTGEAFPFNLVTCVRLAGTLSGLDLEAALAAIQRRHPLLRSAVRGRRGAPRFELDEDRAAIPVRPVERRGDETWKQEVERELGLAFDARRAPLVRCVHVSGGRERARHELLLTFHHAIVDAVAALTVLRRALDRVAGEAPAARGPAWADSIPESADTRLPPPWRGLRARWRSARFLARQIGDEIAYRRRTRGVRAAPPEGPFHCRVLGRVFEEPETAALVRATRRRRVSVWSALNAAMLLAVARRRYRGRALRHRYFAFPVLRPYLEPPAREDEVGSYFTLLRQSVLVRPEAGLWELAAAIHARSDAAAKRGESFLAGRWSALAMRSVLRQSACRMGTAALSYAGAVDLGASRAALEVESLHAFVSNFPLGPEYTAQARIFRRRLWLDVVYLDSDMPGSEAAALADEMRGLLAAAAARTVEKRS